MELAYDAGGRLAAVALDGRLRVYRRDHRLHGRVSLAGGKQLATVRFNGDGRRIAVGFMDAPAVAVLDAASLAPLALRRIEDRAQRNLSNVAWSHDGATLYAAGERSSEGANTLHRWRGAGQGDHGALAIPAQRVSELQALPGNAMAYSAEDPRLGIVDAQGNLVLDRAGEITDFSDGGFELRASADGAAIGYTGSDGRERIFAVDDQPGAPAPTTRPMTPAIRESPGWHLDPATDRLALRVNGQAVKLDDYEIVRAHAFNAAGDALFLGTEWALRRIDRVGAETWRVKLAAIVRAVLVSGDGQWVIAALSDGTIRSPMVRTGSRGHQRVITCRRCVVTSWWAGMSIEGLIVPPTSIGLCNSSVCSIGRMSWARRCAAGRGPTRARQVRPSGLTWRAWRRSRRRGCSFGCWQSPQAPKGRRVPAFA